MQMRFSPFRNPKPTPVEVAPESLDPVSPALVVKKLRIPKSRRAVTIVHPEQAEGYRLKARLLAQGHTTVDVLLLPETLLSLVEKGHRPHIVFLHDFIAADTGITGVEAARSLRLKHQFAGLVYSISEDHLELPDAALELHGFSGHARSYLQ